MSGLTERRLSGTEAEMRAEARWRGALLAVVLAACLQAPCATPSFAAQAAPAKPAESAEATTAEDPEEKALEEIQQPFSRPIADGTGEGEEAADTDTDTDADTSGAEDECDWELEDEEVQEQSREVLRSVSCHTFRWFDSWWGDKYDFKEEGVSGLFLVGTRWSEYYGLDPRARLRVRAKLPNLSRRWDVLLGRVDEEAYVSDTQGQDRTFYNPAAMDRNEDATWLLGLGHRGKKRKSGWDYSAGVRLRLPPRPYVKAQWYYNKDLAKNTDFRFRQTFFWRSDRGFGVTTRGDLAWSVDERNVLRLEAFGTKHDDTKGVQWYGGHTWYHLLGGRSAFSLRSFVRGETDAEVPLQEYGFDMIWRRPFTREWMYLSMGPSLTWPREEIEDEREMNFGFNLWIEIEFGNWSY